MDIPTTTHTGLLIIKAIDANEHTRNIGLIYNKEDSWFSSDHQTNQEALFAQFYRMVRNDTNIVGYQGSAYVCENGVYKLSSTSYPSLVK